MSRMVLEMEHLSPYTGSARRTWRQGSYAKDSDRHIIKVYGNGAFLL